MAVAAVKDEPSMEEILASIRRIISEQDGPAASPAPAPAGEAYARAVEVTDDVLDLTTIVNDDGTLTEIGQADYLVEAEDETAAAMNQVLQAAPTMPQAAAPTAKQPLSDEMFDDSAGEMFDDNEPASGENAALDNVDAVSAADVDIMADDSAVATGPGYDDAASPIAAAADPFAHDEAFDESPAAVTADDNDSWDAPAASAAAPLTPPSAPQPSITAATKDFDDMALLSPATIAASVESLVELQRAQERVQQQQDAFSGAAPRLDSRAGSPTLEDLTRQMLNPLLQEWLNANLPEIVERIVREEVERLVKKA